MYGRNVFANATIKNELMSDLWIQHNVPGGLNSPLGEMLDNIMGGNPNPTFGEIYGDAPDVGGFGYDQGYGNRYSRW